MSFAPPVNANSVSAEDGDHPFSVSVGPEVAADDLTTDLLFGPNEGTAIWRWQAG
ncbi:MAG: hypothetical protein ACK5RL_08735 [Acidimicrobiales bacterium]